jgi:outer membrane protein TolC
VADIPAVRELVALALENSPDAKKARHMTAALAAGVGPAGAPPDPRASFGVQRGPDRMVAVSGAEDLGDLNGLSGLHGILPGATEYMFSLGQEIPWPGKLAAKGDVARAGAGRGEAEARGALLALEADVLAGALEILVVQARRSLLESQLGHWGAIEAVVKARMDQGGSGAGDAVQAMQERSRLRLRLLELDSRGQGLVDGLNRLAARDMGAPIDLAADVLALPLPRPPPEGEVLDDLKARSPEWLTALADARAAEASHKSAKMDRYPDFFAGAGVSKMGAMPPAWKAEVGVSVPLWGGRKQGGMVKMAALELQAAESARSSLALTLAARARELAREWALAYDTAGIYAAELIPASEAALEILTARFQSGGAPLLSIVEALNALLADHERRLDAVAQVHSAAIAQRGAKL